MESQGNEVHHREGRLSPELGRMEWRTEKIEGLAALAAALSAENCLSKNMLYVYVCYKG